MDHERFDHLTRSLSSRRTILGAGFGALAAWLSGRGPVEAKRKPCGKTRKRCGKGCIPKRSCCLRTHKKCGPRCIRKSACCPGTKRCGARCIPVTQCCTHADCGLLRHCANGVCVIGQGTCPVGADICGHGTPADCDTANEFCSCYRTTTDQTRCGDNRILRPGDNACITDQDCATQNPGIPGVFCTRGQEFGGGGGSGCGTVNFCQAPCPG